MMDTADVQEMVLVVVRQEAFHLRRIHTAIRLTYIDHRQIKLRENIDFHPFWKTLGITPLELLKNRWPNR